MAGGVNAIGNLLGKVDSNHALVVTLGEGSALTLSQNGIGVTSTDGLVLQNTTDAAAGAQQMSPRLRFHGEGWKTDATAASQTLDIINEMLPVEGASAPTANLLWRVSVNGGAYGTILTLSSGGLLTAPSLTVTNVATFSSTVQIDNSGNHAVQFSPASARYLTQRMASDAQIGWEAGDAGGGASDFGFARIATGVGRASAGANLAGYGQLAAKSYVLAYASDGALAIAPGTAKLTKAGVNAMTIADPAAADEGTVICITAQTANAHTVSNAAGSGFNAGGGAADVATFGGAIGDNLVIVAINTKWNIVSLRNVTLA